jgi:hypothetical protein
MSKMTEREICELLLTEGETCDSLNICCDGFEALNEGTNCPHFETYRCQEVGHVQAAKEWLERNKV